MLTPAYLTDDELQAICRPLKQNAAMIKYLQKFVTVRRRPDGSPLVKRADWDRQQAPNQRPANAPKWTVA